MKRACGLLTLALVTAGSIFGLPSARAAHLVLSQTTYDANGARNLSPLTTISVTDPQTGLVYETREFKYTTPDNFPAMAAATVNLWFVLHGGGGSTDSMNRYFELIPSTSPTVVVFPEALPIGAGGDTRWRNVAFPGDETDPDVYRDVVFIEQLRDELLASNPQLSPDHVYASGFSSGGAATWMLLCYRSGLFAGFGIYAKQLHIGRRDGGCGDGLAIDPATGSYSVTTGYETLTGQSPDLYGHNPSLNSFAPTKPVFYHHGTADENLEYSGAPGCSTVMACPPDEDPNFSMAGPGTPAEDRDDLSTKDWLITRHDLRNKPRRTIVPDEDPVSGFDMVDTYARRYKKNAGTAGVTSREDVVWFELRDHVHALSALDHWNDVCANLTGAGPSQTPCNSNPNASKDFDTSLATLRFFETHAGMLT